MINLIREYLLKLVDNDEVDAYLLTYIYIKILEVFRKHDKVVNK